MAESNRRQIVLGALLWALKASALAVAVVTLAWIVKGRGNMAHENASFIALAAVQFMVQFVAALSIVTGVQRAFNIVGGSSRRIIGWPQLFNTVAHIERPVE